jgi:hypothetical protein
MRTVCTRNQKPSFQFMAFTELLSVQACCVVEVEIFSVDLQAGHLQSSFAQEETPYYKVIH